jgi:hypothetical protein
LRDHDKNTDKNTGTFQTDETLRTDRTSSGQLGGSTQTQTRGSAATATREWDPWTYGGSKWAGQDLVGYKVEAPDGEIGKVDEATDQAGANYIVVDTGPWIFGKKALLPAGVIARVDDDDHRIFVNRTKDQIESAPEFDPSQYRDTSYREQLGSYYGPEGRGWTGTDRETQKMY